MAKQNKLLAARKPPGPSRSEEALSLRSAESLGRVIGTLQRQLDNAIHRFTGRPVHRPKRDGDEDTGGEHARRRKPVRATRAAAPERPAARRTKPAAAKPARTRPARAASAAAKRAARPK
jgi:hypothetical protein